MTTKIDLATQVKNILSPINGGYKNTSSYLGGVATAVKICDNKSTAQKQANSRSSHIARDNIYGLQLSFPNWFVDFTTKNELGSGGAATVTAAIEYPVGTFTAVTWGAASQATGISIADATTSPLSNPCPVFIPAGATFFVRNFWNSSVGFVQVGGQNPNGVIDIAIGEAYEWAVSGLADKTMSGTIVNNVGNSQFIYTPCLIVAPTVNPSCFLIGDSRVLGVADSYQGAGFPNDLGELARSIGPAFAYCNSGISGDKISFYIANNTLRLPLAQYYSHIICELGESDVRSGSAAANVLANLAKLYSSLSGKIIFQTTYTPVASGTFSTLGGQTTDATNPVRVSLNTSIRAGLPGLGGYFDIASAVEYALNDGLWQFPGLTADGVHELQAGALQIKNSGVVDTTKIIR